MVHERATDLYNNSPTTAVYLEGSVVQPLTSKRGEGSLSGPMDNLTISIYYITDNIGL